MTLKVNEIGAIKVVLIPETVDHRELKQVESVLQNLLNEGIKKILCDFSKTEYVSQEGLAVFITALNQIHAVQGQIAFCMLKPAVREVFSQAGLTQLYKYYDMDESLQMSVLQELAAYFDEYDDIHGIRIRRTEEVLYIEIFIEFDREQKMGRVQQSINKIKKNLEQKIKGSEVLIVPRTSPLTN